MPPPRAGGALETGKPAALEAAGDHAQADLLGPDPVAGAQVRHPFGAETALDEIGLEEVGGHHELEGRGVAQSLQPSVRLEQAGAPAAQQGILPEIGKQGVRDFVEEVETGAGVPAVPVEDRRPVPGPAEQCRVGGSRRGVHPDAADPQGLGHQQRVVRRRRPVRIDAAQQILRLGQGGARPGADHVEGGPLFRLSPARGPGSRSEGSRPRRRLSHGGRRWSP